MKFSKSRLQNYNLIINENYDYYIIKMIRENAKTNVKLDL